MMALMRKLVMFLSMHLVMLLMHVIHAIRDLRVLLHVFRRAFRQSREGADLMVHLVRELMMTLLMLEHRVHLLRHL